MKVDLILTVIAKDKPGIVERIADVIADHGGSWVESSMSRLCGEFAGLLRVRVPKVRAEELQQALRSLNEQSMQVSVCTSTEKPARERGRPARIILTGIDHTGIVLEVTRVLAQNDVNVEQLETEVFQAPLTGEAMFSAHAEIRLPEGLDILVLRDALETIAQDILVDIELNEEVPAE